MDTVKLTNAPTAANMQVWRMSPEFMFAKTLSNVPPTVPALVPPPLTRLAIFPVRFCAILYGHLTDCSQYGSTYCEVAAQGNNTGR